MAVSAALAALIAFAPAQADSPKTIARRLLDDYRKAYLSRDINQVSKLLSDDFTMLDVKGRRASRDISVESMRKSLANYQKINQLEERLIAAKRTPEGIIVTVDTYVDANLGYKGRPDRVATLVRSESLLVQRKGTWLFGRIRVVSGTTTPPGQSMLGTPVKG